jgi:hypothetical protein
MTACACMNWARIDGLLCVLRLGDDPRMDDPNLP